ncbi:MAG: carboxypeptidase regulatory-like domain-containing protein [Chitinispirillaceae bacterium]|nr:carboxypeptidase regulatory-like domain-containing protein [Chitinispirillaceae bacterium]
MMNTSPLYCFKRTTVLILLLSCVWHLDGGTVRGTVLDSMTNAPVAGALLELCDYDSALTVKYSTSTATDGAFVFDNVAEQRYFLKIDSGNYVTQWLSPQGTTRYPQFSLWAGPISDPWQIYLTPSPIDNPPSSVIKISVKDTLGAAVNSGMVELENAWDFSFAGACDLNSRQGYAFFENVQPGRYAVFLSCPPYPSQYMDTSQNSASPRYFITVQAYDTLEFGTQVTGSPLGNGRIYGKVFTETGSLAPDIVIGLFTADDLLTSRFQAMTDASGIFRFEQLQSEGYFLKLGSGGMFPEQWFSPHRRATTRYPDDPIYPPPANDTFFITLSGNPLDNTASSAVFVAITDSSGMPITMTSGKIECADRYHTMMRQLFYHSTTGMYAAAGLPPGDYSIRLEVPPYPIQYYSPDGNTQYESFFQPVQDNDTVVLETRLKTAFGPVDTTTSFAYLQGRVADSLDRSVSCRVLILDTIHTVMTSMQTASDGLFGPMRFIALAPHYCAVEVQTGKRQFWTTTGVTDSLPHAGMIRAAQGDTVWLQIKLVKGNTVDTTTRKSIEGVVTALPSYAPLHNVRICAMPSHMVPTGDFNPAMLWAPMMTHTDSAGYYVFRNLPPDDYLVAAVVDSQNYVAQFYQNADIPANARVVRVDTSFTLTINFLLRPGGMVSGMVTSTMNGAPIQDAVVNVHEKGRNRWHEVTTSANGAYNVAGIISGTCHLWIYHPHYLRKDSVPLPDEFTITEGQTYTYPAITMEPGGRIAGSFTTPVSLRDSAMIHDTGCGLPIGRILLFPDSLESGETVLHPHYSTSIEAFCSGTDSTTGRFVSDVCPPGMWRAVFQPSPRYGWNDSNASSTPVPWLGWGVVGGDTLLETGMSFEIKPFDTVANIPLRLRTGYTVSGSVRDSAGNSLTHFGFSAVVKKNGRFFTVGFSDHFDGERFVLPGMINGEAYYLNAWADGYPGQFWSPETTTAGPLFPYRFNEATFSPLAVRLKRSFSDPDTTPSADPITLYTQYSTNGVLEMLHWRIDQRYTLDSCVLYGMGPDGTVTRLHAAATVQGTVNYSWAETRTIAAPMLYVVAGKSAGVMVRSNEVWYDPRQNGIAPDSLWIEVRGTRWGIGVEWGPQPPDTIIDSISLFRRAAGEPWKLLERRSAWSSRLEDHQWGREDSGRVFEYRVEVLSTGRASRAAAFTLDQAFFEGLTKPLQVGPYEKYKTIQSAIDASQNGDVIRVESGVYRENLTFRGKALLLDGDWHYGTPPIIDAGGGIAVTIPWTGQRKEDEQPYVSGFKIINASVGIQVSAPAGTGQCLFAGVTKAFDVAIDSSAMVNTMRQNPFLGSEVQLWIDQCTFVARSSGNIVAAAGARGLAESTNPVRSPTGHEHAFLMPVYSLSSKVSIAHSIMTDFIAVGGNSQLPIQLGGVSPTASVRTCDLWRTAVSAATPRIEIEGQLLTLDPQFIDTVNYFLPDQSPLRTVSSDRVALGYDSRRFNRNDEDTTVGPSPIKNLVVRQLSLAKIMLSWSPSPDSEKVVRYCVARCPGDTSLYYVNQENRWEPTVSEDEFMAMIDTFYIRSTSFLDSTIIPGKPYLYVVMGVDSAGHQSEVDLPASIPLSTLFRGGFTYAVHLKGAQWHMMGLWGADSAQLAPSSDRILYYWDDKRTPDKLLSQYAATSTLRPGKGYWFRSERDTVLQVTPATLALLAQREATLSFSLTAGQTGWNQVSLPLPFPIAPSWLDTFPAWEWNPDQLGYVRATRLEPWKGYWIHTASARTLPLNNDRPLFAGTAKRASGLAAWELQLVLSGATIRDEENYIGVVDAPDDMPVHAREIREPPAGFLATQLYFVKVADGHRTRFSMLYHAAGGAQNAVRHEWLVAVSPSSERTRIDVRGCASLPRGLHAFWIDANGAVPLEKDAAIEIPPHDAEVSACLVVTANTNELALYAKRFRLDAACPNPFRQNTTLVFVVPYEWGAGGISIDKKKRHVCVEIFDIAGKKVATLLDREIEVGAHRMVWHGNGERGRVLRNGMYIVRIRGGDSFAAIRLFRMN